MNWQPELLNPSEQTDPLQDSKSIGQETVTARLVAWEAFHIQQQNRVAACSQVKSGDGTRRPGPDNQDVPDLSRGRIDRMLPGDWF